MKPFYPTRQLRFLLLGLGFLGLSSWLAAYPPAPFYTLHGMVRDQVGNTVRVSNSTLILLKDNAEIARTVIFPDLSAETNYELPIRIDQNRASTRVYSVQSVPAQGLFSLVVDLDGERFYPIEVAGNLRAGNGGERVRLDLTLGSDTNRDGLPDAWQEWVLYQAGHLPGSPGWDINLVTKNGDFDGDGVGNFQEYISGTFAGDSTDRFDLVIKAKTATAVAFEFFAITDKVYTIEQSTDLATWVAVPFSLTPDGPKAVYQRAAAVGISPAYIAAPAGSASFFRLTVR